MDTSRHYSVFNPAEWGNRRIDVIGVGATGSRVALSLAKLGVRNLHLWDDDTISEHNIPNQVYGLQDLGLAYKATALARIINRDTGLKPTPHAERWTKGKRVGQVVFCMPDSMATRAEMFEHAKYMPSIRLVLDSRMGSDLGMIYTYSPADQSSIAKYAKTLYSDDDAITERSECGTSISVGPTAEIISGFIVWRFMVFAQAIMGVTAAPLHKEIAVGARELAINVF